MAGKPHLTDAEWGKIESVLPKSRGGRPRTNDRAVITGILHALASGAPFSELERYGNPSTLETRFRRWDRDGTLERICAAIDFRPLGGHERRGRRDLPASAHASPRVVPLWLTQLGQLADDFPVRQFTDAERLPQLLPLSPKAVHLGQPHPPVRTRAKRH